MSELSDPGPTNTPKPDASLDSIASKESSQPPHQLHRVWQQINSARGSLGSLPKTLMKAIGWFQVDEAKLSQLLDQVRTALPTTEVLLIGKPQTGKSSIIRGLTGISAEVVGQGLRPHTTHTQRYNYPTDDLPLLVFTDTVGLGEGSETPEVIQELAGELTQRSPAPQRAKVLVVTLKVNDFATDSLHQTVTQIRQQHPEIPALLAVTCLHELYPPKTDHPPYPPQYEAITRAFGAKADFAGCDRAVLIDFTLAEDGYTPVFYGLEHFIEGLAALLPEAESQVIHQLLREAKAGAQVSDLYREVGRRYIAPFAIIAATLAAVPIPLATMPVLTALQVTLVTLLGRVYGQTLKPSQAGGVTSAIAGGFVAQLVGRELVKFIPGGSVVAASWAAAYTWALGEGACIYFGDLMGGKQPNPQKIRQVMDQAFKAAQIRFKEAVGSPGNP